jgi:leucyl aminopeptidase
VVLASGEYKAAANEALLLFAPAGLAAKRLLLVGLGKLGKATVHNVRNAAGTAVRFAKPRGVREVAFVLPEAEALVAATTLHGNLPEALRLAHLIAGGITTGVSRGRA